MTLYGQVEFNDSYMVVAISSNLSRLDGDIYICKNPSYFETDCYTLTDLHRYWKPYTAKEMGEYGLLINGNFYPEDSKKFAKEDKVEYNRGNYSYVYKINQYIDGKLVETYYE